MLEDMGKLGLASTAVCLFVVLLSGSIIPMIWAGVLWYALAYSANYVDQKAS